MYNILVLTALLLTLSLFLTWSLFSDDAVEVRVVTAQVGPISSTIRVTGRVVNDRTVTLTALVDGQINAMLVNKGDPIEAGQVLAHLDMREANALLAKSQAVVEREQHAVREASRRLERLKDMSRSGGASQQTVEDAESRWRAAQARLRVAQAEQHVAEVQREKVAITAPWDGVITDKNAEVGQWVEAGTQLFTLVAHDGREIEAHVDAGDSGVVKPGQQVMVTCDAFPGWQWSETVQWISPAIIVDQSSDVNSFAARMSLGANAPDLLLGQQVDIEIVTARRDRTANLP